MCTAVFKNRFLLRTVDRIGDIGEHYVIGTERYIGGVIRNNYGEIWIDGINKYGLVTALLNYRREMTNECTNKPNSMKLHPGRLVQFLLENCRNVHEASEAAMSIELTCDAPEIYPHFIIADADGKCAVLESDSIQENPIGVLTNAPSLKEQIRYYKEQKTKVTEFYSSRSRFCRIADFRQLVRIKSVEDCFNLLTTVALPEGVDKRKGYRTVLRSVMSCDSMTYSYAEGCSGKIKTVSMNGNFDISMEETK